MIQIRDKPLAILRSDVTISDYYGVTEYENNTCTPSRCTRRCNTSHYILWKQWVVQHRYKFSVTIQCYNLFGIIDTYYKTTILLPSITLRNSCKTKFEIYKGGKRNRRSNRIVNFLLISRKVGRFIKDISCVESEVILSGCICDNISQSAILRNVSSMAKSQSHPVHSDNDIAVDSWLMWRHGRWRMRCRFVLYGIIFFIKYIIRDGNKLLSSSRRM